MITFSFFIRMIDWETARQVFVAAVILGAVFL